METNENVLINKVEDFNIGNTIKSGDQTLLKYKILDGDGEILDLAGSPCRAVVKKHGREVYSTTDVTIAADNVAQFRITEVLPADEKKPYMVEFIINEDDKPQIFPSKDTIELYILSSSILEEKAIIQSAGCKTAEEIILKKANPILDGIDEAEATRRTSEDTRVTNELAREQSEEDRKFEEMLRQLSEADRGYGESTRVAAESNRKATFDELVDTGVLQTNINTKLSNLEQTYAPKLAELDNNEDARKTAESARETNEAERILNEDGRVAAENERQTNYNELVDTGVIQENINQKLSESEQTYAPRLTNLEQNDADLTAQLAQNKQFLSNVFINPLNPPENLEPALFDGETDDSESLQAIIDFASENNFSVMFPARKTTVANLIIPKRSVILGNFSTVLKARQGVGVDGNEDMYIENLFIDGRKSVLGGGKSNLGLRVLSGSIINNIKSVNNAGHGIRIQAEDETKNTYANHLVVNDNGANEMDGDGLYINNSHNVFIDGVEAFGNMRTGVVVTTFDPVTNSEKPELSNNVNITNVTFGGNWYNGFNCEGVNNPKITNIESDDQGFSARVSKNGQFKDMKITGFGAADHDDIYVDNVVLSPKGDVSNVFVHAGKNPRIKNVQIIDTADSYRSNTFESVDRDGKGFIENILVENGHNSFIARGYRNLRNCNVLNASGVPYSGAGRRIGNYNQENPYDRFQLVGGLMRHSFSRKPNSGYGMSSEFKKGDFVMNNFESIFNVFGWICVNEENQEWKAIPITV